MNVFFRGVWSSVMATSAMTMMMFRSFQNLPPDQEASLPPAQLAKEIESKVGIRKALRNEAQIEATLLSHYGYGAATALLYTLVASKIPGPSVVKGSLFGLGVWVASYYGIIPGLKLSPSARQMTAKRNSMMIGAHLIWGASLGYSENQFRHEGYRMLS